MFIPLQNPKGCCIVTREGSLCDRLRVPVLPDDPLNLFWIIPAKGNDFVCDFLMQGIAFFMRKNKPTASIAFQIIPKTSGDSIKVIDAVIAIVRKSGVTYEVGPMETTMEGDLDTLLDIVREAQDVVIKNGATSVFTNVKIAYNPKGVLTIAQKVTKHR